MRYCEKCGKNTEHKELMQPKPAQRPKTVTDFIKQFIALESRSYQVMDTDSLDRAISSVKSAELNGLRMLVRSLSEY